MLPGGEEGELVFTSLTKQAMPSPVPHRDLTACCRHRAAHARMEKVTGRTDDMIILRGVNLFPTQIEELIMRIPGAVAAFPLHLTRDGRMDQLAVHVERRAAPPAAARRPGAQLGHDGQDTIGVTVSVTCWNRSPSSGPWARCAASSTTWPR